MFDPSNVSRPEYWFDKPLTYTIHAKERCLERRILPVDFLPINSRLVDCETDVNNNIKTLFFKVNEKGDCYVLSHDGVVITVYDCKNNKKPVHILRKKTRRYHDNKLAVSFGSLNHKLIPRKYIR